MNQNQRKTKRVTAWFVGTIIVVVLLLVDITGR